MVTAVFFNLREYTAIIFTVIFKLTFESASGVRIVGGGGGGREAETATDRD